MDDIIRKCLPTYEIERNLGEGIYGTVYQVRDGLKQRAVKVVPLLVERSMSLKTTSEMGLKLSRDFHAIQEYYKQIKGPGVVEIHDFHLVEKRINQHNARGFLVVLMELCAGNLSDYVIDHFPLPPDRIFNLMHQLSTILDRLSFRHRDSYLITDLKPSNLLINTGGQVLIGDLGGIQRLSSVSTTAHSQLTPNWSAPEIVIRGMPPSVSSVVFSFGLVSYFMFEGYLPYEDADFLERFQCLRNAGVVFTREDIPDPIRKLIHTCLCYEPEARWKDFESIIGLLTACDQSDVDGDSNHPIKNPLNPLPLEAQPTKPIAYDTPRRSQPVQMALPAKEKRHWRDPFSGMVFVWIPGGSFFMGRDQGDAVGFENEFPLHKVIMSGFWMGKYPVTQIEWMRVMKSNPSFFKRGDDYPVEQVSWKDAVAFCRVLSEAAGGADIFRLPTEAQWEYAARCRGRGYIYAGGDDIDKIAWHLANADSTTHPVGQKAANGLDLFDMSGNVWEWCQDVYRADGYAAHSLKDPFISDGENVRVRRGGCWFSLPSGCRAAKRAKSPEDHKNSHIGFRVVRIALDDTR